MKLEDVKDFVASLGIVKEEQVYIGKLDARKEEVIGCYHLDRGDPPHIPLGGMDNASYDVMPVSFLLHWNRDFRQTEAAAKQLYDKLMRTEAEEINGHNILFIQMLVKEPQYIGTDEAGIYEAVIEAKIYTERRKG